jgi:hypothetical protein
MSLFGLFGYRAGMIAGIVVAGAVFAWIVVSARRKG